MQIKTKIFTVIQNTKKQARTPEATDAYRRGPYKLYENKKKIKKKTTLFMYVQTHIHSHTACTHTL